jgi:hypothetical protein
LGTLHFLAWGVKGKVGPSWGLYLPYLAVRDDVLRLPLLHLAVKEFDLYFSVEELEAGLHLACQMTREGPYPSPFGIWGDPLYTWEELLS